MLTLTRKEGQAIRIGDNVVLHVKSVRGARVVLMFDAPLDVVILRDELPSFGGDVGDGLQPPPAIG